MSNAPSLKKNIVLSAINTFITLAFPLITYPYVARILLPENMGLYNFVFSIVTYFLLFVYLGIPIYATKRVAALKNDKDAERKVCSEIFFFNIIMSVIVAAIYVGFVFVDLKARQNQALYFIVGLQIFTIALGVEWYFKAKENFKFIAIRNLITKVISIALIFLFVKTSDDILIYAIIMIGAIVFYNLWSCLKFVKEVKPTIKGLNFKPHLLPIFAVFILNIAGNLNSNIDNGMLGYMVGNFAVGQYTAATKIIKMATEVLMVVNVVLMPRISSLLSEGKTDEVKTLVRKSFILIFALALPASVGISFLSEDIVLILSGAEYSEAITTMAVMGADVLLVVMTNFLGIQILYTSGRTKETTVAIAIGAFINVALNIFMIQKFSHLGAGITTLISNGVILLIETIFVAKYFRFNVINKENLKTIIATLVMAIPLFLFNYFGIFAFSSQVGMVVNILYMLLKIAIGVIAFAIMLLVLRHGLLIEQVKGLFLKVFKRKQTVSINGVENLSENSVEKQEPENEDEQTSDGKVAKADDEDDFKEEKS